MRPPRWRLGVALVGALAWAVVTAAHDPPSMSAVKQGSTGLEVRWVLRERDLLNCRTPARMLRHIQAEFGPAVRLRALLVDGDLEYARSFLRSERLAQVSVARGSRAGSGPTGLYLMANDSVVARVPAGELNDYLGSEALAAELARILPRVAPSGPATPPSYGRVEE